MGYVGEGLEGTAERMEVFFCFKLFLLIELAGLNKIGEAVENDGDPQGTPK